jgi:hypothetical protein
LQVTAGVELMLGFHRASGQPLGAWFTASRRGFKLLSAVEREKVQWKRQNIQHSTSNIR